MARIGPLVLCGSLLVLPACVVDPACYGDGDCPDGQLCDQRRGACVEPECAGPAGCPAGNVCLGGRCLPAGPAVLTCPEGMVAVGPSFCIDAYEASRPDATAEEMGADTSRAVSQPGAIPWHVNPLTPEAVARFDAACRRAGKRLCSRDEWHSTCAGSTSRAYTFGDTFHRETCNGVDTFCDDHCAEHGIADCNLAPDCGYAYGAFRLVPTGRFPACVSENGAFDVSGNVWEVVPSLHDRRGYEVRGGAFNCAGAAQRLRCTYNAGWAELYAGFRCCWGPGDAPAP